MTAVHKLVPELYGLELAKTCAELMDEKKAEDIVVINIGKLSSFTDYFVLASANNERQVQAIAKHLQTELKQHGKYTIGSEGLEEGHWALLDYGDVIVHVFLDTARSYYDLDGFWAGCPHESWQEAKS